MLTAKQILIQARERISDPKRWTQKALAKDDQGGWTVPIHSRACQWCAIGALICVGHDWPAEASRAEELLDDAGLALFGMNSVCVNDNRDHAAVMQMYAKAIELAPADAGDGEKEEVKP